MTEPADYARSEPALPGLDALDAPGAPAAGELEVAARQTIAAWHAESLVGPRDAVMLAALVVAARQLDRETTPLRGKHIGKGYAVANLLAQLRETFVVLRPEDAGEGDGDAFDELAGELRCASGLCDHAHHRAPV